MLAVAVRLIYLAESLGSDFFSHPVIDAQRFVEQARLIAAGDWLGGGEVFWHPPLYTYLLAGVMAIVPESAFYVAVRVVQALMAGASAYLLIGLGQRVVEHAGVARWTPYAAAILFSLWGPLIYFDGELLATSLEVLLYLMLIDRAAVVLRHGSAGPAAAAGLIAGLAAITRPNILLFVGIAGVWWWLKGDRRLRRLTPAFLVPLLAIIACVGLRNWAVADDVVPISSNGGINFYIGNNPAADSTIAIRPGRHWEDLVEEPRRAGLHSPSQSSAYFLNKGISFATSEPVAYTALLAIKTAHLLSGVERKRNVDPYHARGHSWLLSGLMWSRWVSFPFGLMIPLALLGLWVSRSWHDSTILTLQLFIFTYSASIVLFFVTARYRAPLVPALLIFACIGVNHIARQRHRWRLVGSVCAVAILVNLPQANSPEHDPQLHHDRAEVALRQSQWQRALDECTIAIDLDPTYASAFHNRAVAHLHLGDATRARTDARRALQLNARMARAHIVLARASKAIPGAWREAEAEQALRNALQIDPDLPEAHADLGRLLRRSGRPLAAITHLETARDAFPHDFWSHYELGTALYAANRWPEAIGAYKAALAIESRPEAFNALAVSYVAHGQPEMAIEPLQKALALAPNDVAALTNRGWVELQISRPSAALDWFRKALRYQPEAPSARAGMAAALEALGREEEARRWQPGPGG
ncbi:MAG: tetratricopeptide repeat protein [Gemmatimonadetes bacterium]|nr:tetratricopeptide repeat protein [Gemmatimonadota bacterium]MBT6148193.1 tetratricopeptide repeat protein [Gemmatimonadota bacterium]MBT7859467.1 tetratricopeptide repeat protein [Gemmatimonadota bacterium]